MNDPMANALSKVDNAERAEKTEVVVSPISKQMVAVFNILKKGGWIKDFEAVLDARGGQIKITLAKSMNRIGAIKPRFPVKFEDLEKFEKSYLPAKDFGRLIISTPQGMMTHIEARKKKIGGILIAYVY